MLHIDITIFSEMGNVEIV